MSNGRDLLESEEKKSYGAVFLLSIALLLACTVWAIWQDSFSRHLWKKYKADFYRTAIERYTEQAEEEEARLAEIPEYTALNGELGEIRDALAGGGEEGRRLEELAERLDKAEITVLETDLELRIVKGEIEEAWYLFDVAIHEHHSGDAERAKLQELEAEKDGKQERYDAAVAVRDEILGEIATVRARESEIVDELRPYEKELEALELKLDSVSLNVFGRRIPRVPTIEQFVLKGFERNNFDQWVDRVERCTNCHVAIDRAGFEDLENPLKTHPDRGYYLGNHEVRKFGCTPCHGGQGAAINSVELAHGFVEFWEDPLLDIHDKVQARCVDCHGIGQDFEGSEVATRGEWLFVEMGCHGCHLVQGIEALPKVGPSLKRVGAKTSPEWLVSWIEDPHAFRPRTRMPHFFLDRDESVAVASYLLSSSLDDSKAWLAAHGDPRGVDPKSEALVAKGRELTRSLGCLGCHGFEPDEFASQVALGKDTAPNLARIAEKTNERWIYHWLKNPREYSEVARMPRLRLSDSETAAITSYLATLQQDAPAAVDAELRRALADPATIEEGERLVRSFGCHGCHVISGMEAESRVSVELSAFANKHLEELFFGNRLDIPNTWDDWTINKILTPRTYATERIVQAMPEFGFDPADARALTVFLASQTDARVGEDYLPHSAGRAGALREGRLLVTRYNCQGCHSFDGKEGAIRRYYEDDIEAAPPILVGEGIKLQPEWFFDFLKKPMRLRPWLDVRMPTFGLDDEETTVIVDYFAAVDGYQIGPVVLESRDEAHAALATDHEVPEGYFDCGACHPAGPGRLPEDEYSVSRLPLTEGERLAWMAEHLGIELAGDEGEDEQIEELREYLGAAAD